MEFERGKKVLLKPSPENTPLCANPLTCAGFIFWFIAFYFLLYLSLWVEGVILFLLSARWGPSSASSSSLARPSTRSRAAQERLVTHHQKQLEIAQPLLLQQAHVLLTSLSYQAPSFHQPCGIRGFKAYELLKKQTEAPQITAPLHQTFAPCSSTRKLDTNATNWLLDLL